MDSSHLNLQFNIGNLQLNDKKTFQYPNLLFLSTSDQSIATQKLLKALMGTIFRFQFLQDSAGLCPSRLLLFKLQSRFSSVN